MYKSAFKRVILLMAALMFVLSACTSTPKEAVDTSASEASSAEVAAAGVTEAAEPAAAEDEKFVFGLIMVGPRDEQGWSGAHFRAAEYVTEHIPNSEFIWFDKLNVDDNPDMTLEQVVDDMVSKGAKLIFSTSAEMGEPTNNSAEKYPDVTFIHVSGDAVLAGKAPKNVGNIMAQMEYGKMMAGCAAALTTETGSIGYLGPLIDPETRRFVNSAYLGASYCWENIRGEDPADLTFTVKWIGYWYNLPGVTLDPTQVANDFVDSGVDVMLSGIDTTEVLVVAEQRTKEDKKIYAIPYDFELACETASTACLGVPYYNWGPEYLKTAQGVIDGTWKQEWIWAGPDWSNVHNIDTSAVDFKIGPALSDDAKAGLEKYIAGLGDGSINPWAGPLYYQDGSVYVKEGEVATVDQIWYTEQLLKGITGLSSE